MEIEVSKIDYYTWKIGAIVLLLLLLTFIYVNQNHNKYANPSGYVESLVETDNKGICLIRFPAECPTTTIICQSDLNYSLDEQGGKDE